MDRQTLSPAALEWQPRPADREVYYPSPSATKHARPRGAEGEHER